MSIDPIESLVENANVFDHNAEAVTRFVLEYYIEMNRIEKRHPWKDHLDSSEVTTRHLGVIREKNRVHDRFWAPSDDPYWRPSSHGNREKYNITEIYRIRVATDFRGSFVAEVNFHPGSNGQDSVYLIENRREGETDRFFITNCFSY